MLWLRNEFFMQHACNNFHATIFMQQFSCKVNFSASMQTILWWPQVGQSARLLVRSSCACRIWTGMAFNVLDCQLLNVDGRTYRVMGQPGIPHHQAQNRSQQHINFAEEEPELGSDEGSSFDVQQEDAQYVVRLAYDVEVPRWRSLISVLAVSSDLVP